jgi:peptide/nickel transport system ATP-binding protein
MNQSSLASTDKPSLPSGRELERGGAGQSVELVKVTNLVRTFDVSQPWLTRVITRQPKQLLHAVNDISFDIWQGETFALVGESGCGKSTVARLLVGLYAPSQGTVSLSGNDVSKLKTELKLRRDAQMIFQDPYASLNPRWRVADIVAEPLLLHGLAADNEAAQSKVGELLTLVGLSANDASKYPHQFSGGQRQRISIARALATEPAFLVCDEPTSALDVSVQAQVLNLLKDLQPRLGITVLFISHNLQVVHHVADRIGVMYLGKLVEIAPKAELFVSPKHPYTRMLLDAIPDMAMSGKARTPVGGEVPNPLNPPSGCTFHPRCPQATDKCKQEAPVSRTVGVSVVACHWAQ